MKIVIGHKNLNLEELYQIAYHPSHAEVVVDSVINAEFAATIPGGAPKDQQIAPVLPNRLIASMRHEHQRAVILVKLLQIVKLKRGAVKPSVDFLVNVLNNNQ